ncbi:Mur ligase family protein [Bacillus marasmi]|uniref:Mur ligase family protein n=1 Tax=Bacillus marasmi TaxID=1926279 RepID=UPI0011C6F9A1|nr:UDP-N-acetylmuramoyl-tripeptide--D-alanyl-D-alanine ligase [Bacillus marasmi]
MKSLSLNEILNVIGPHIIRSSALASNPIIQRAMDWTAKDIDDHTLVFHMDHEKIRGKYWKNNQDIAIITDKPELCTNLGGKITLIETKDLEGAYWNFIEYYRGMFDIPVIGVTGTCGKTTTKEMMKQILSEDFKVKATWKSMNSMSVNLRYVTGIEEDTEVAVFEMPVAYPGYLRVACRAFKPQIRILLNIGVHHLADCDTPEVYMKAKGEIVDGMDPQNDVLIVNADDENIRKVLDPSPYKKVIYFGKTQRAQFRIDESHFGNGGMNFTFTHESKQYQAFVPGYGEHNVYNALAAIAAVSFVGISIPTAITRLASFKQVKSHLEFNHGTNGSTIIDDTWNSAPLSMDSALQVLKNVSIGKKSIALLGYMPQLGTGTHAFEQYSEMGKRAAEAEVDLLVIVGEKAKVIGESALKHGYPAEQLHFCETGEEIYQVIQAHLEPDTNILLKITHRVMKKPSFQELRNKLIKNED